MPRTALLVAFALLLSGVASIWTGPFAFSEEALSASATRQLLEGNSAGAADSARRALALNPASAYRWCDLAEVLLTQGDTARAAGCFRRAVELAPATPPVLLRAFYGAARLRSNTETMALGRTVLDLVPTYDDVVFGIYRDSGIPALELLGRAIPPRAAPPYFRYLLESNVPSQELAPVWKWLGEHKLTTGSLTASYVDFLFAASQLTQAREVLSQHHGETGRAPMIWNGGFEHDAAGASTKLDWQVQPPPHAEARRDCDEPAVEGRCSLRVDLAGAPNQLFDHVQQTVTLPIDRYRLSARIRTAGVTTDEGFGLRALAPGLDARTQRVTGTSNGWLTLSTDFTLPAGATQVRIQLFRLPTWKQDNILNGTVWVDAVELTSLTR